MPLARANGCALTHPLSACCQQERTFRKRQSQGPGVICRPRSRRQKRSKPLPRPLWQNEAKKPRSLKRLQPGADGNRGKRARPNHRAPPSPWVTPAFGSRVFVCDNLAFIGDHVIGRKHTVKAKRPGPIWRNGLQVPRLPPLFTAPF